MWASRLFWKTFLAYAALTLIAAAIFVGVIAVRQRTVVANQLRARLGDLARLLQRDALRILREPSDAAREAIVEELAGKHGVHITVIDADGVVRADSRDDPELAVNQLSYEEVSEAFDAFHDGFGRADRESKPDGPVMMYVAQRIGFPRNPQGVVRVARPASDVDTEVDAVLEPVWVTAAVMCVLGLAITYFVLRRIVGPIERMTHAARSMTAGDVVQHVEVSGRDELGTLAESFNTMSHELAQRIDQLRSKSADLEANGERLETVLGAMIEGVVALDAQQRILFANQAARRMLESTSGDVVGRPIWEVVHNPTVQQVARDSLSENGEKRPARSVEFELPRTQTRVALLASRLPGNPSPGIVLVLHDVTELRRLENLRKDFVANVSHELKTPLSLIQTNTETLIEWAVDEPDQNRKFLGNIVEQAERLNELIQDMLRLARIESAQEVFDVRSVHLDELIEVCVEEHVSVAEARGVMLTTDPARTDVAVRVDEEGLRTILRNLVENAIKYTPEGGRVLVRWSRDGDHAVIEVEDTGIGIAEEHRSRIFERFYRVDKARSRDVGGTGLGLSIVKHLVNEFQGTVEIESGVEGGSRFVVRLPIA